MLLDDYDVHLAVYVLDTNSKNIWHIYWYICYIVFKVEKTPVLTQQNSLSKPYWYSGMQIHRSYYGSRSYISTCCWYHFLLAYLYIKDGPENCSHQTAANFIGLPCVKLATKIVLYAPLCNFKKLVGWF